MSLFCQNETAAPPKARIDDRFYAVLKDRF
jgi:hypothetical protein